VDPGSAVTKFNFMNGRCGFAKSPGVQAAFNHLRNLGLLRVGRE
jgi:hypothetical protein